jgi:hypothetical protein
MCGDLKKKQGSVCQDTVLVEHIFHTLNVYINVLISNLINH